MRIQAMNMSNSRCLPNTTPSALARTLRGGSPRIIYVGGNTGVGKTTVVKLLGKDLLCDTLPSGASKSSYVTDIHKQPDRFAFEAQLAFLITKIVRILQWRRSKKGLLVVDRSPYEDARVFAKYWHHKGSIDDRAFRTYGQIAHVALVPELEPSVFIY